VNAIKLKPIIGYSMIRLSQRFRENFFVQPQNRRTRRKRRKRSKTQRQKRRTKGQAKGEQKASKPPSRKVRQGLADEIMKRHR